MGRSGGAVFLIVMTEFLSTHWLDIVTTILGLIYLVLEYRASIALWVVGIVMPAMDIYLYWSHGLYGDAGMAVYYTLCDIRLRRVEVRSQMEADAEVQGFGGSRLR